MADLLDEIENETLYQTLITVDKHTLLILLLKMQGYSTREIAAVISEEEHSEGDVQMFMGEIRRYAAVTELDETVLNRLINRILIGELKKVDGVKTQEVRIVYNFVGEL